MSFILTTKLHIPRFQDRLIPRPRLIKILNTGSLKKLILISASAGYGKTTLLSQWIAQNKQRVAWFAIDAEDNDPVRFFSYVISAIRTIHPEIGADALKLLQTQTKQPALNFILGNLINDLAAMDQQLTLVLEDYHLIETREIHEQIAFLLDHMPAGFHILMATRSDPPLMLARLRSQNQIVELRAADLSFSLEETTDFFNKNTGLGLSPYEIARLDSRIEGWIAGLQMAAISMQGSQDVSRFVDSFTSSNRFVLDYLMEEVFQCQTPEVKDFLLQTSILNRLNAELCNAVTLKKDGQEMLEYLEQANLFIIPLDDERYWYRYHHLFADLLQKWLKQTFPGKSGDLHFRASCGYEKQCLLPEAIEHALEAGDFERAEGLIGSIAEELWHRGEQGRLLQWTTALPMNRKTKNPRLYAVLGMSVAINGNFEESLNYLRIAEENIGEESPEQLQGMIAAVRTYIADYSGNIELATQNGEIALTTLNDDFAVWRCLTSMAMGDVYVQKGPLAPATDAYREAIRSGKLAGINYCISLAQHRLVVMYHRRARLREAMPMVEKYLAPDNLLRMQSGSLNLIYGELLYEFNRLEEAAEQLQKSIDLCQYQHHAAAVPYCKMFLARIRLAQGKTEAATQETNESVALLQQADIAPWVVSFVLTWKIRYHVLHGELQLANEVLQSLNLPLDGPFSYPNVSEYLSFARYLVASGKTADALQLLERLNSHLVSIDWLNLALEVKLVWSLALHAQERTDEALQILKEALTLSQPEGYLRIFIDEGEPMRELLQLAKRKGIQPKYVNQLLFEMDFSQEYEPEKSDSPSPEQPLSDREWEVLRLLKTHLSSTEIARELFISTNTARTHIKSIYSKLGVHNRQEAVEKVRGLGK